MKVKKSIRVLGYKLSKAGKAILHFLKKINLVYRICTGRCRKEPAYLEYRICVLKCKEEYIVGKIRVYKKIRDDINKYETNINKRTIKLQTLDRKMNRLQSKLQQIRSELISLEIQQKKENKIYNIGS